MGGWASIRLVVEHISSYTDDWGRVVVEVLSGRGVCGYQKASKQSCRREINSRNAGEKITQITPAVFDFVVHRSHCQPYCVVQVRLTPVKLEPDASKQGGCRNM